MHNPSGRYQCAECLERFRLKKSLVDHYAKEHGYHLYEKRDLYKKNSKRDDDKPYL